MVNQTDAGGCRLVSSLELEVASLLLQLKNLNTKALGCSEV